MRTKSDPPWIVVDTETDGLHHKCKLKKIAWCGPDGVVLVEDKPSKELRRLLASKHVIKVAHNMSFDKRVCEVNGYEFNGGVVCTMILMQVVMPTDKYGNRVSHGLKQLARSLFDDPYEEEVRLAKWKKTNKKEMWQAPDKILDPYARKDVEMCYQLLIHFLPKLDEMGMSDVFDVEMELLTKVAIPMNGIGMQLNESRLKFLTTAAKRDKNKYRKLCRRLTGNKDFNPGSPDQVAFHVYKKAKVRPRRLTKSGKFGTDETSLIMANTTLSRAVIDYRRATKALSTYLKVFNENSDDNYVLRANWNQNGARTGRSSSSGPNLQNLPRPGTWEDRGVLGAIREAIVARPNYYLILIDYEQIELRLAAHFSDEEWMIDAFNAGQNLHDEACLRYFGMRKADPGGSLLYPIAKTMNFAMLYGCQEETLAEIILKNTGRKESIYKCADYIARYHEASPKIDDLFQLIEQEVIETGGVTNPYGRFVPCPANEAYKAVNYKIQGTAADIIKRAMIKIADLLAGFRSRMIGQVHDEVLFEIHRDELLQLLPQIVALMEDYSTYQTPMQVGVDTGPSWGRKVKVPKKIWMPNAA